ncbi:A-kinase anchor protein 14-like [Clytia hemisphaerica]|uniref:A-kinase anchor protein 14 n=1 Tax=Clytia hemisphaerica TaxID=252671 RepID=A0A7M5VF87_9CNID
MDDRKEKEGGKTCEGYEDYLNSGDMEITQCVREAHLMVDEVIQKSSNTLLYNKDAKLPYIKWLTIQEFTIQNGVLKIDEFIKTWDRKPNWLYCVDFLCQEHHEYSERYRYRVKWSIPTRRKPIPRATASVYFTFDVSNVKPLDSLVEVYYIFESSKLVHRADSSRFREKWLSDVIDAKVLLMDAITF